MAFIPPQVCAQYENFHIRPSPYYGQGGMNVIVPQFGQGNLVFCCPMSAMARVQLGANGEVIDIHASQITIHNQHKVPTFEEFMAEQAMKQEGSRSPLKRSPSDSECSSSDEQSVSRPFQA